MGVYEIIRQFSVDLQAEGVRVQVGPFYEEGLAPRVMVLVGVEFGDLLSPLPPPGLPQISDLGEGK